MPLTTPPGVVIVATDVVMLLQVPPAVASASVMVELAQKGTLPVMAAGCIFTVTVAVDAQLPIV